MPLPVAAFPCCRDHDLFAPVEEYGQSIPHGPGNEAYWLHWQSSFHGNATILLVRLRGEAMVPASTARSLR
jgi:hypothetical protein